MSGGAGLLAGLSGPQRRIAAGYDADLVVWIDAEFIVEPSQLQQRHKITPSRPAAARRRAQMTFVRGQRVWHQGRSARPGSGSYC